MQMVRILADAGGWEHMGGWGWSMAVMGLLMMILFVGLIVWAAVYSTRRVGHRDGRSDRARMVLDGRYAQGEIERDEYLERRAYLEG